MQATSDGRRVVVTLSHKNLMDLLSQAMVFEHEPSLYRQQDDGTLLEVRLQPNSVHYETRVAGRGSGLV